jgi:hypothetical protein
MFVDDDEAEFAAEMLEAVESVPGVKGKQNFGVRVAAKSESIADEVPSMAGFVVDFTVEDEGEAAFEVGHRLSTAGQIDDVQSTMGNAPSAILAKNQTALVRAAMLQRVVHPVENLRIDRRP